MVAIRSILLLALLATATPAAAQWSRVTALPVTSVFAVWANADTITACVDTAVYVSTNAGATWKRSARIDPATGSVQAAVVRNGRLYAATFGQGAFESDDLGDTWQSFSQGLVGGFLNTQLQDTDLLVSGDSLYVATAGAGVYVRRFEGGIWSHYGEVFEPNQASNVNGLAGDGARLLACAGANGMVFFRDPGDADWTLSWLDNVGLEPGLSPYAAVFDGNGWVVGTSPGVFVSTHGQEPWTFVNLGLGSLVNVALAGRDRVVFGAFVRPTLTRFAYSGDDGANWHEMETLSSVFVYKLADSGTDLYAGRGDGLWRRSVANVGVPAPDPVASLRFALAGALPVGDEARFRFELPAEAHASLEVFDVTGRRVGSRVEAERPAGINQVTWDARRLAPGVYAARLQALGRREVVRFVRAR